jgi:hypothetical protein
MKASCPSELGSPTAFALPPASLGHPATRASLPSASFLAKQAVPPSVYDVEKKLGSRPEEGSEPRRHP